MARIKKNLSLEEDVLTKGMQKAKAMFSGNFSMYITYLIHQDCKEKEKEYVIKEVKQEIRQEEKVIEKHKDSEALSELDNILEM